MVNRGLIQTAFIGILNIQSLIALAEPSVTSSNPITFKFTPSYYLSSDGNNASDLNLRASIDGHTAWVGEYADKNGFQQTRLGYEYKFDSGMLRPTLSALLAIGGLDPGWQPHQ